jgi:hypothetical protein
MNSKDLINAYYVLQCKSESKCTCNEEHECAQCYEDRKNENDLNALESAGTEF